MALKAQRWQQLLTGCDIPNADGAIVCPGELLDVPQVERQERFLTLGGDSISAFRLHLELEAKFGVVIDLSDIFDLTISGLSRRIWCAAGKPEKSRLEVLQEGDGERTLFCVHTAGGGALFHYEKLVECLPDNISVIGLLGLCFQDNNQSDSTIEAIAGHCLETMRMAQPQGPYHLCGYSSAGVIAFEMARRLATQGGSVATLTLVDAVAYSLPTHPG